ncbi:MAG: hypothetical protein ACK6D4_20905 [Planctomyces sp.]
MPDFSPVACGPGRAAATRMAAPGYGDGSTTGASYAEYDACSGLNERLQKPFRRV